MRSPDVSVVIAVYDAMPYLTRCISSVTAQTIGTDRLEIVAVDDGSTDGSGAELDRLAASCPALTVLHLPHSGGPSRPRNIGLDRATGRYVFFLDADDYLGPEALERLVAMADRQGSDVVLGKMVGVGRRVPASMFDRNQPRADLVTSRVYYNLNVQKLFRRELIERHGLRFREDVRNGEDRIFTARAYFLARTISVVADYDCYYLVARDDGANLTTLDRGVDELIRSSGMVMQVAADHTEPGPVRDALMLRHFRWDLLACFDQRFLDLDEQGRKAAAAAAQPLLDAHYTAEVARRLPALWRLRAHCLRRGMLDELAEVVRFDLSGVRDKAVVSGGRVYGAYPFFRDPARAIPDSCYDITDQLAMRHRLDALTWRDGVLRLRGHAYVNHVDTHDISTEIVARERGGDAEYRFAARNEPSPEITERHGDGIYDYWRAGFSADIDLARAAAGQPLPPGLWDLSVAVRAQGVAKQARIGSCRVPDLRVEPLPRVVAAGPGRVLVVTPYLTVPHGNLTLDVGERKHRLDRCVRVDDVGWAVGRDPTLTLHGRVRAALPPDAAVAVRVTGADGAVWETPATVTRMPDGVGFAARLPLRRAAAGRPLSAGRWRVSVALTVADRTWEAPATAASALRAVWWWRRGHVWRVGADAARHGLVLVVQPVRVAAALRRVRRLVGGGRG